MSKQEILDRIQDILYQNGNLQALDLLRHDLENDIIEEKDVFFDSDIKVKEQE